MASATLVPKVVKALGKIQSRTFARKAGEMVVSRGSRRSLAATAGYNKKNL